MMFKHYSEALRDRMFDTPIAYTVKEGGTWHSTHDVHDVTHVHALMFNDGMQWDEINGWRDNTPSPTMILWTPPGIALSEWDDD